jgi:hypothetical protein
MEALQDAGQSSNFLQRGNGPDFASTEPTDDDEHFAIRRKRGRKALL